jgi:hypothetical protein
LTSDFHMAHLVFERGLGVPSGVVLTRDVPSSLAENVQLIVTLMERSDMTFDGHFTVVNRERMGQRLLPAP